MIVLPDTNIRVLAPVSALDYFDRQFVVLLSEMTPLDVWNRTMSRPQPVLKVMFRIRDTISSWFGVKKIGGFSGAAVRNVVAGDHLDFFLVEYCDDNSLVLTARDRHLDVMTCISTRNCRVEITSSVLTHNWFGQAYMIPVGVAHRWIVKVMLKRLKRTAE